MSDTTPLTYLAYTSTKEKGSDLLRVRVIEQGDHFEHGGFLTALHALRMHIIDMYAAARAEGEDVTDAPINEIGLHALSYQPFTMKAYGYYVGLCTGGLAEADAIVQRELVMDHQRISIADTLAHALDSMVFMEERTITADDIVVERDEIRILRRQDHPPFIGPA